MNALLIDIRRDPYGSMRADLEGLGFAVSATCEKGKPEALRAKLVVIHADDPCPEAVRCVKEVRDAGIGAPTILIMRRREGFGVARILNAGADECVQESVGIGEIGARIKAILRRERRKPTSTLHIGDLVLDIPTKTAIWDDNLVNMTVKEFEVLEILLARRNMPVRKETIIDLLYNSPEVPETKIVDVFICKIRKKLARVSGRTDIVETVWGSGYMVRDPLPVDKASTMAA